MDWSTLHIHTTALKRSPVAFDMLRKQDILIIRIFSLLKIVHVKIMIYHNGAEFLKLN